MEKSCKICAKQMLCEKEQKEVCKEYIKQPYTVLEEVKEGKIFRFRRIE